MSITRILTQLLFFFINCICSIVYLSKCSEAVLDPAQENLLRVRIRPANQFSQHCLQEWGRRWPKQIIQVKLGQKCGKRLLDIINIRFEWFEFYAYIKEACFYLLIYSNETKTGFKRDVKINTAIFYKCLVSTTGNNSLYDVIDAHGATVLFFIVSYIIHYHSWSWQRNIIYHGIGVLL
jgi:hypothetical protein